MKTIIFIALMAFAAADPEYYDLERLDMNELIKNTDEFKTFLDCLLDREECSKRYSPFRAVVAEAVEQKCKKCNPFQEHSFWLFLLGVRAKFPSDYYNFRKKYDPENKYFDDLEEELRNYAY